MAAPDGYTDVSDDARIVHIVGGSVRAQSRSPTPQSTRYAATTDVDETTDFEGKAAVDAFTSSWVANFMAGGGRCVDAIPLHAGRSPRPVAGTSPTRGSPRPRAREPTVDIFAPGYPDQAAAHDASAATPPRHASARRVHIVDRQPRPTTVVVSGSARNRYVPAATSHHDDSDASSRIIVNSPPPQHRRPEPTPFVASGSPSAFHSQVRPPPAVVDGIAIEVAVTDGPHGHAERGPTAAGRSPGASQLFLHRDTAYYSTGSGRAGHIVRHVEVDEYEPDPNDSERLVPAAEAAAARDTDAERREDTRLYETPAPAPVQRSPGSSRSPTPLRSRGASRSPPRRGASPSRYVIVSDADKGIALRCIRCVLFSAHIPQADFHRRLAFSRSEARRIYESMSSDTSWARGNPAATTPPFVLLHNAMHEVLRGNSGLDWVRWFSTVSRRRVEEAFKRMTRHTEAMGLVLDRNSRGFLVTLPSPRR